VKEAAPAIAARYYMNRNFFVNDPDAFTVSTQTVKDHPWNGGVTPLTIDEAKVSIALSSVSGGLFEIGDDLPTLGKTPERVDLVKNTDLLDMARLGIASTPVDLMSYESADGQPSIFFLRESPGQRVLTIFNWADRPLSRTLALPSLGIEVTERDRIVDIFDPNGTAKPVSGTIAIEQPAHSVAMFKIVDSSIDPKPDAAIHLPQQLKSGERASFTAGPGKSGMPVLSCLWSFGDGTTMTGSSAHHAYTSPGTYNVQLELTGLGGVTAHVSGTVKVEGEMPSIFDPSAKTRTLTE
jgi:hypothetical protein